MKFKVFSFAFLAFLIILTGCKDKEYTIQFLDWDETIIVEKSLKPRETIVAPADPTREGYNFTGWDKEFRTASEDLIIKAQYKVISYTVRFYDIEGNIIKEEVVTHASSVVAPSVKAEIGYEFIGWDKEFKNITSDLEVRAQYKKSTYVVNFYDDLGNVLKEELVTYGLSATAPKVTAPTGYEFIGWDKEFDNIISNTDVTAKFKRLNYTVRFYDDLGNLLDEVIVEYESDATAPVIDEFDNKEFIGWDRNFTNVKSDLDVKAIFKEVTYTIEFFDGTTKLSLDIKEYKPGEEKMLPSPNKEGYIFAGWYLSDISLYNISLIDSSFKGNLKLYSRWVKTDQNQFTIPTNVGEFVKINKNPHSSGNGFVYQPQFPAGASTSVTAYDWKSSDTKVATISAYSSISIASSGYAIITATLKSNPSIVYYAIIQTSADGVEKISIEEANAPNYVRATFKLSETQLIEKVVQKGGFTTPPTPLEKEGYIFTGWVGENKESIYNITKDTTFIPTYTEGNKSYAGKTISILGDSISTYAGYIPPEFTHFYPYPTADLADVNQTWWMQFINHFGLNLLVNNSWSGSAVAGSALSAAHKISRLEHLYFGEVKPDVILIFIGANDAGSMYINLNMFDTAYNTMIQNIKTISPNSEIILCTLPSITLYTQKEQEDYNNVIEKYAISYGLKLINLAKAFTREKSSTYLVDSAHPNRLGMDKLAEVAIDDFLDLIK